MQYLIGETTAQKIRDLIGDKGQGPGVIGGGSGYRQVAYVQCSSWNTTTHEGTGLIAQRDASAWSYEGTAADMLLLASSGDLSVGQRYLSLRFGEASGGRDIFVAFALAGSGTPTLGCGLTYDEDGKITVNVEVLAGDGLAAHTSGGTCTIDVVPGCHITLHGGESVGVDVGGMVSTGLEVDDSGEGCDRIKIKTPGCGVTFDGDGALTVFAPEVAGLGLEPGETPCQLAVKTPGCGVTFDTDGALTFFAPEVAGLGLEPGATPCQLQAKTGCGITTDGSGALTVFSPDVAGAGLQPGSTPCQLEVGQGCGVIVGANTVSVDVVAIAGDALQGHVTEHGCTIDIVPGCHISLHGGESVNVEVSGMVSTGLEVDDSGEGCDKIKIKTPGCGVTFDGDGALTVFAPEVAGKGLEPGETPCELAVKAGECIKVTEDGVSVDRDVATTESRTVVIDVALGGGWNTATMNKTVVTETVKRNACGLIVDITRSAPTTTSTTVTIGCCSSSTAPSSSATLSSSSSRPPSSSSSSRLSSSSSRFGSSSSSSSGNGFPGPSTLSSASNLVSSEVVILDMAAGAIPAGTVWVPEDQEIIEHDQEHTDQDDYVLNDFGERVPRPWATVVPKPLPKTKHRPEPKKYTKSRPTQPPKNCGCKGAANLDQLGTDTHVQPG